jgi:lysophospholipase L1-like esterase
MIGARDRLAARLGPGFSMSARVGRQADEFVAIVQRLRREGHTPDAMIIQMGNNGPLYGEQMEAIQRATSNVGHLFLINDHAPVSWVEESNDALAEAGRDWPHTTVIDWKSAAESGPGLLWDDIHLTPAGAAAYARLVAAAVREEVPFRGGTTRRGSERG